MKWHSDGPSDPSQKICICGEHGGEPDSVKICHRIGLNYVSCPPSASHR